MPKPNKIDVITVNLIVHIPVDRDDRKAVDAAYKLADGLCNAGDDIGETAVYKARLNRVPAPAPEATEPEPKSEEPRVATSEPDESGLDPNDPGEIPEHMRRVLRPAAAE